MNFGSSRIRLASRSSFADGFRPVFIFLPYAKAWDPACPDFQMLALLEFWGLTWGVHFIEGSFYSSFIEIYEAKRKSELASWFTLLFLKSIVSFKMFEKHCDYNT